MRASTALVAAAALASLSGAALVAAAAAAAAACAVGTAPASSENEVEEECPGDDEQSLLQLELDMTRGTRDLSPSVSGPYRQTLANFGDLQYTGTVTLGKQNLAAVMDTGSFEILVFSKDCFTCGTAGGSSGYGHRSSSTYSAGRLVKTHVYGSGSAMSFDGIERFAAGPFEAQRQDFWEAMDAKMPVLQAASFQAIVGLGPPGEPQRSAHRMLVSARKVLDDPQVSPYQKKQATQQLQVAELVLAKNDSVLLNLQMTYISACFDWAVGAPGYLVWNDLPPLQQPVPFTKLDVISPIHWSLNLTGPRFNGPEGIIDLGCAGGCEAIMDTGTSLIAVPTPIFQKAAAELNKLDANCTNMQQMPDLVFSLGGQDYSMPPQSYIGVIEGSRPNDPQGWMHSRGARACELLLLDAGSGASGPSSLGPMWIIGMPFFRYYYTTFDLGPEPLVAASRKIWTAPAAAGCKPSSQAAHDLKLAHARTQPLWRVDGSRIRMPRMQKQRSGPSPELVTPNIDFKRLAPDSIWRSRAERPGPGRLQA